MEALSNKVRSRAIIKLGLGLFLISTFSYSGHANCKEGLSASRQAELINSLQSYEPLKSDIDSSLKVSKLSDAEVQRINEYCDQETYSTEKYCLERKYMNDGFYIVTIFFRKDAQTPVQPRAPHIKGSKPFQRDNTAKDAFLLEMQGAISMQYLGSDYSSFHSVKVMGSNHGGVVIKIEVSEASELVNVLADPRVFRVDHIGVPPMPLEETP